MTPTASLFSDNYAQARERFLAAARQATDDLRSFPIDGTGAQGEALGIDVAMLRPPGARALLVLSSATHGVEGFCGSGCQLALLTDEALLAQMRDAGLALLLVHALNPYGFSWLSRTNEHNIDLNRNAQAFESALPANTAYGELHAALVPHEWPPSEANRQRLAEYVAQHGFARYQQAVTQGQYTHPDGVFHGGTARSASLRTLVKVLAHHGRGFEDIAWIDVHTGLGAWGHGEKIYAGRRDAAELERAQRWWGADLAIPFAGRSASADITGQAASLVYEACPHARSTAMALEFGTVPIATMLEAVRGEAWLRSHPEATPAQAQAIRRAMRDAFYSDDPVWQGSVLGQSRVATLQALRGLTGG